MCIGLVRGLWTRTQVARSTPALAMIFVVRSLRALLHRRSSLYIYGLYYHNMARSVLVCMDGLEPIQASQQRDWQDHRQNTSYWTDKPTGFQMSAHCTQPSSQQATVLADVPKHACFPLETAPKTAAPGLASSLDSPTAGVMSAHQTAS